MKLVINYLKKNLNMRKLFKVICLFSVVWLFVGSYTFAADQTTWQNSLESTNFLINTLISLLSRLRIFLASIAGKLLTNDRVYGSVIHLDIYLWKLRNIMKNFANFTLVALVLVEIVKIAIGKSNEWVSKVFTNTLIAAVLIQASWFVMWAVIDISNVTVSAVWSFPSVFMKNDPEVLAGLTAFAQGFQQTTYEIWFTNNEVIRQKLASTEELTQIQQDNLIQSILPSTNSVSGPLIFMWASIFRFNEYTDLSKIDVANRKKITLSVSLKLLVISFYVIALLFLVVANIIRIWFLWVFIVLSPIIVLYLTFLKKWSEWISKYFDIGSVLSAIFKPTIFVWYISLMLIVLILVKSFFASNVNSEVWWVTISANENSSEFSVDGVWHVQIKWNILKDQLSQWQSMFSDLFVFLLGIFLMWQLVKLAISDGWPIWKTMDSIWLNAKLAESAMSTIPVMPGGFGIWAYKSAMTKQTQKTLGATGIDWNGRWDGADFKANLDSTWAEILEDKINNITWTKSYWKINRQWKVLQEVIEKNPEKFWMTSIDIAKNVEWWLSASGNYEWMWLFKNWLETSEWRKAGFSWTLKSNSSEDIKEFFDKDKKNIELFHKNMQDATFKWLSSDPKSYDELQRITYGTNEKSE